MHLLIDRRKHALTWCVGIGLGIAACQYLASLPGGETWGSRLAWFPGAILLGSLITTPRRMWPALTLSAATALVATEAVVMVPITVLIACAAWLLRHGISIMRDALLTFRHFAIFLALTVVLLPTASATVVGLLNNHIHGAPVQQPWSSLALSHALGYALYIPFWLSARRPSACACREKTCAWHWVAVAAALCVLAGTWRLYGDDPTLIPMLCLAPAPIIILGIIRGRASGSCFMVLVVTSMAAFLAALGHGPFVRQNQDSTTLSLQLWSLLAAVSALALSVVAEQRVAARVALAATVQELRRASARQIEALDRDRARLARDLHDDINQRLAVCSIRLGLMRREAPHDLQRQLDMTQANIVALSNDVRQMSHDLHPSCLRHATLRDALEALAEDPRRGTSPVISIHGHAVGPLPSDVALCMYRVAQEALGNVQRHANATRVMISLGCIGNAAVLQVTDDGCGFDADEGNGLGCGLGLTSMRERTRLLGGSLSIKSAPGEGVDLCIRIPLPVI